MQRDEPGRDEEAWRSIVEHYGDRAELEDDPGPAADPPARAADHPSAPPPPDRTSDPDRFVPPDPPLPPRPTVDRLAAWAGVFGAPIVLLVLVLTGLGIPALLGYGLVVAFVGGFVYLVVHLPRAPEDPWDDGARL